jgi:nucleotide-binding universal stress UspA family protein
VIADSIVVGVDGSAGGRAALRWAADESRIRRRVLVVAHATDHDDTMLAGRPARPHLRSRDDRGECLLRNHAAEASARQPGVIVTTMLSHSTPADALVELGAQADLVVVGSRGWGQAPPSLLGSASEQVAARALCPVAVVPERLTLRADSPRVAVGISPTRLGRLALGFALEEARLRSATLAAVSAMSEQHVAAEGLDVRARRSGMVLLDELRGAAASYSDVVIERTLADSEADVALLNAAYSAQLLVVGGRDGDERWSTRLGPVPAAIAHLVPCPIVIVKRGRDTRTATRGVPAPESC